jgi:hypothetical protein
MTIDPTDEMREAFQVGAGWPGPPWRFGADVANGLAAALDLIADDVRTVLGQPSLHHHQVPGVWDDSGTPCQYCAARKRLASIFNQDGRS